VGESPPRLQRACRVPASALYAVESTLTFENCAALVNDLTNGGSGFGGIDHRNHHSSIVLRERSSGAAVLNDLR